MYGEPWPVFTSSSHPELTLVPVAGSGDRRKKLRMRLLLRPTIFVVAVSNGSAEAVHSDFVFLADDDAVLETDDTVPTDDDAVLAGNDTVLSADDAAAAAAAATDGDEDRRAKSVWPLVICTFFSCPGKWWPSRLVASATLTVAGRVPTLKYSSATGTKRTPPRAGGTPKARWTWACTKATFCPLAMTWRWQGDALMVMV